MKKALILTVLLVVASVFVAGNVYGDVHIYDDYWPYYPSTWLGDWWAAGVADLADIDYSGDRLTEFTLDKSTSTSAWGAKVVAQKDTGGGQGLDLTNHTKMFFQVKAKDTDSDGVKVYFGMGATGVHNSAGENLVYKVYDGTDTTFLDITSTVLTDTNLLTLTDDWYTCEIDLTSKNMVDINDLWWFRINSGDNSAVGAGDVIGFHVDNVKYIGGSSGIVTVSVSGGMVGVAVEGAVSFLGVPAGGEKHSTTTDETLLLTNIGDTAVDFWLSLTNPSGWTVGSETGPDQYILSALFTGKNPAVIPDETNYRINEANDDVLTTSPKEPGDIDAESFVFGTEAHGVNVADGSQRRLWLRFDAPTSSITSAPQEIIVTVTVKKH